jgi:FkbM family methyltransferase
MKDDYDLSELEQISVRGLRYNIMPRYKYHYLDNSYEQFSLDLIDRLVTPGSVAIDVGAHYGIYSLLSAKNASAVYAFEPVPENHQILDKNIKLNNLENVHSINKAVSDSESKVTFNIPWASDSAGFYEHPNAESIRKVKVQTARIDNELSDAKNVSFVKIDTEGHEIHVLEGMKKTLANNGDAKLLIEFNPDCLNSAGFKPVDLIKKIQSLDYDIFAVHEDSRQMAKVDDKTPLKIILRGKTYLNFLCIRRGKWLSVLLSSHSSSVGGAELRLVDMLDMLLKNEKTFILPYVILPADGPIKENLQKMPVALEIIPMQGWVEHQNASEEDALQVKALNVDAISRIAGLFKGFLPDVALTNSITIPWTAMVAKNFGVPHLWNINEFGNLDHGFTFDYGFENTAKMVDDWSQTVLVNSKAVFKHYQSHISEKKLRLVYQGVTQKPLTKNFDKSVFSSSAELKMAVLGRVMPSKGQFDAVQALKIIRDKGVNAELMIIGAVGAKDYLQTINDFCSQNKLTKYIHFIAHKPNPQDYVDQADIFITPSRKEAYGRVTIEAMFLGKAVLGTRSGGTPEIIEAGKSGLLYNYGDFKELANEIYKLFKDQTLMKEIGDAAVERAQKFSAENDSFLTELLALRNSKQKDVPIAKDLLLGAAYLRDSRLEEKQTIVEAHQKEIADFSEEYNKVYAAYNTLEKQVAEYKPPKVNRLKRKIVRTIKGTRNGK